MGLDNIVKKLQLEVEQEIEAIEKEAKEKEKKIELSYQQKFAQKKQELLDSYQARIKRETDMELWKVKSELKKEILQKKKQVVDSIFAKVLDNLKNLPESDQEKLVQKYLQEIKGRQGVIVPAKGREQLIKKCLQKEKTALKLAEESIEAAGGFIWQSEELNIDYTWESLVRNLRERTELEITKALFS